MPALRSAEDLLTTELREIHSAERQLLKVLPRLAKKTQHGRMRSMLDQRREQGEFLVEQIEESLDEMNQSRGRQKNVVAEALIEDMTEHLEQCEAEELMEPLMIGGLQKVEHYCIAAWGTAAAMGRLLNEKRVVRTMERAVKEGLEMDDELSALAEEDINPRMLDADGQQERQSRGRRVRVAERR